MRTAVVFSGEPIGNKLWFSQVAADCVYRPLLFTLPVFSSIFPAQPLFDVNNFDKTDQCSKQWQCQWIVGVLVCVVKWILLVTPVNTSVNSRNNPHVSTQHNNHFIFETGFWEFIGGGGRGLNETQSNECEMIKNHYKGKPRVVSWIVLVSFRDHNQLMLWSSIVMNVYFRLTFSHFLIQFV